MSERYDCSDPQQREAGIAAASAAEAGASWS